MGYSFIMTWFMSTSSLIFLRRDSSPSSSAFLFVEVVSTWMSVFVDTAVCAMALVTTGFAEGTVVTTSVDGAGGKVVVTVAAGPAGAAATPLRGAALPPLRFCVGRALPLLKQWTRPEQVVLDLASAGHCHYLKQWTHPEQVER